jgi:flagellar protein FlaI
MAIDEAEQSDPGHVGESDDPPTDDATGGGDGTVAVGEYTWEDFMRDHGYESEARSYDGGSSLALSSAGSFDPAEHLGFEAAEMDREVEKALGFAKRLEATVDARTVDTIGDVDPEEITGVDEDDVEAFDEDEFFRTSNGHTTVVNRYDLEKAVPVEKKTHFREEQRYWVNKPYSFVIVFHSVKENEKKYYAVEPYLNEIEKDLREFLTGKLRTAVKYSQDEVTVQGDEEERRRVIERETKRLLRRYDLYSGQSNGGLVESFRGLLGNGDTAEKSLGQLEGIETRPEPAVVEEDSEKLTEYQVEKLLYLLKRDFIGYERIDPIKHDINVEDISCDGYNTRVFVYHTDYEQIISNIQHGKDELDDFVVKLAQRSGKGISKRRPQVDATLPDGSRSQLTLGREVSDHGTNYTIRQFKDVPFTPVDLINWSTFSLEEMAFLWLCIENHKSLIFAGGTASGKTTSLNAISLFIPSNTKIVSIEDTREVELPQRNWVASVTRPSFGDDDQGDVDEFDLLEAALRQRPDYIVMGEVRGEEGRTLFQVMSTGHTTYTTFHADTVGEVLKRFTTDPINVSKTMFTALDLVSIQTQTRVQGNKVRRNKVLTEVNHYDAENDEINVQDVYQWQAETDQFIKMGNSNTLGEIKFDRGWGQRRLDDEIFNRKVILAYLIQNEISDYVRVAATIQAFINDPETILSLIANDQLVESLEDLREMESVNIQVDPEKEALVPRPSPPEEIDNLAADILEEADERVFEDYRGETPGQIGTALGDMEAAETIEANPSGGDADAFIDELDFGGQVSEDFDVEETDLEDLSETEDDGGEDLFDRGGFEDEFGFGDDSGAAGAVWDDASDGDVDSEEGADAETVPARMGTDETDGTRIFGDEADSPDPDDEMESIFGGDSAEENVSLFDEGEGESIFEDTGGSIFGSDPDGDDEEDEDGEENGSIFDQSDGDGGDGSIFGNGGA